MTRMALFCLLLAGCRSSRAGQPVVATRSGPAALTRGDLAERYLLTGELEAFASEKLVVPETNQFNISIRWLAADGAVVKAGEKVAEFDNSAFLGDLEEKKLAAAQSRSDLAHQVEQNAILEGDKKFAVETALIGNEKAKLEAGVAPDTYPLRVYQEKQLELQRTKVALDTANDDLQAQIKSAALDVTVKQIALEKAEREIQSAETAIAALTLKAPRDGVVVIAMHPWMGRKVQTGDGIYSGMAVATLPDLSAMRVTALLSDVDDGKISSGARVLCFLDAYPELPFHGTITEISPVAREPSEKSWRRSFQVTVVLDKTDPVKMVPGMSVRVEVDGKKVQSALLAPLADIDRSAKPARLHLKQGWTPIDLVLCNYQSCAISAPAGEADKIHEGSLLGAGT